MPRSPRAKVLWFARLERRFHRWRERRARARGLRPAVTGFPGYGTEEWVRVLGRVLIAPPIKRTSTGEFASLRGWRSFAAVPVGFGQVDVTIDGVTHRVVADRGGVIDAKLPATLSPGWQSITMSVEGSEPAETRVFIVGSDVRFGVVSDIDDTVMVTLLPRPLLAAWNSFVVDEHARQPVPGMAVMLERLTREHPGTPVSTCRPVPGTSRPRSPASCAATSSPPGRSCSPTGADPRPVVPQRGESTRSRTSDAWPRSSPT